MSEIFNLHFHTGPVHPREFYVLVGKLDHVDDPYHFHTDRNIYAKLAYFQITKVFFNHVTSGHLHEGISVGRLIVLGSVFDEENRHENFRFIGYRGKDHWVEYDEDLNTEQYCTITPYENHNHNDDQKFDSLKLTLAETCEKLNHLIESSDSELRAKYMRHELQRLVAKWD